MKSFNRRGQPGAKLRGVVLVAWLSAMSIAGSAWPSLLAQSGDAAPAAPLSLKVTVVPDVRTADARFSSVRYTERDGELWWPWTIGGQSVLELASPESWTESAEGQSTTPLEELRDWSTLPGSLRATVEALRDRVPGKWAPQLRVYRSRVLAPQSPTTQQEGVLLGASFLEREPLPRQLRAVIEQLEELSQHPLKLSLQAWFLDEDFSELPGEEVDAGVRILSESELTALRKRMRETAPLFERIDAKILPRVELRASQVQRTTYIKDFDLKKSRAAWIADPIIGSIGAGVKFSVTGIRSARSHFVFSVSFSSAKLVTPMKTFTTTVGDGLELTFETPELRYTNELRDNLHLDAEHPAYALRQEMQTSRGSREVLLLMTVREPEGDPAGGVGPGRVTWIRNAERNAQPLLQARWPKGARMPERGQRLEIVRDSTFVGSARVIEVAGEFAMLQLLLTSPGHSPQTGDTVQRMEGREDPKPQGRIGKRLPKPAQGLFEASWDAAGVRVPSAGEVLNVARTGPGGERYFEHAVVLEVRDEGRKLLVVDVTGGLKAGDRLTLP